MDEIAALTPTFAGVSYAKLDELGSVQWPCNEKAPEGTPVMHIGGFVRGKGKFIVTEYSRPTSAPTAIPADADHGTYSQPVQCRRTDPPHRQCRLARKTFSRSTPTTRRSAAWGWRLGVAVEPRRRNDLAREITDRVAPGVVYTTFHHPVTRPM